MEQDNREQGDSHVRRGGNIPGAPRWPAFTLAARHPSPIPVLISVPHAGRAYPATLVASMRHPQAAAAKLEDRYTDLVGQAVARETGAGLLVSNAPRAMIDLNRAPEDMDWDMLAQGSPTERMRTGRRARSGLGLVPRRLPGLGEIWKGRIEQSDLDARVEGIHKPYHEVVEEQMHELQARWGVALLLDLHSMPPLGPKVGRDPAADFVIGDRFGSSCDGVLCAAAFDHFVENGRRAAHNRPYAGGYVLDRHGAPANGRHAMQLEICRVAYLDAHLRDPGDGFADIVRIISGLVRRLAAEMASMSGTLTQAAE